MALVIGVGATASADPLMEVTGPSFDSAAYKSHQKAKEAPPPEDDASQSKAKQPTLDDGKAHVAQGTAAGRINEGEGDQPDSVDEPEEIRVPARVPWRGTAISWNHNANAGLLNIGDDFQSRSHQAYTQTFNLGLNYFLIEEEKWSLAVAASPSFSVEITDSASTTTRREPWFNDLPANVAYRRTLYSHDDLPLATGMVLRAGVIFPTAPASYNSGDYLTTAPAAVLWGVVPLLPEDASPVLNSLIVGGVAGWNHRFGRASTAERTDFSRSRQNALGEPGGNTQVFGFDRRAHDSTRQTLFAMIVENFDNGMQLQAITGFSFAQNFLGGFEGRVDPETGQPCDVEIATGCVDTSGGLEEATGQEGANTRYNAGFFVGMTYFPMPELGVSLSYSNNDNQLGPSGQRQSIAYNPRTATFSAGLAIGIDAIYEALRGPRRAAPFFLVADNKKKKDDRERTEERRDSPTLPGATF